MFGFNGILADAAAPTGNYYTIIMLVAFVGIFYFLMIRPQQKKAKQVKAMLDSLKEGDRVRTIGGLYGKIVEMKDNIVVIEVGYENKVKMAFERSAVAQVNDEGIEGEKLSQ